MARNEPKAVPSGIDYLVSLAAGDAPFRERLLADRLKAAKRAGVRLSESEKTLLLAMPDSQLVATIDSTAPSLAPRRGFLRRAGLWAAGLFGGVSMTTLTGCNIGPSSDGCRPDEMPENSRGTRPDKPPEKTQGIRPDEPPPKGGPTDAETRGWGARPDVPPPKEE